MNNYLSRNSKNSSTQYWCKDFIIIIYGDQFCQQFRYNQYYTLIYCGV